jgi:hypothetical protein
MNFEITFNRLEKQRGLSILYVCSILFNIEILSIKNFSKKIRKLLNFL